MQILRGGNACSEFRLKKLLSMAEGIETLSAHYIYFVDVPEESSKYLGSSSYTNLCDLLDVSGNDQKYSGITANHLIVVPRVGTISPWSTKATDIIHRCDLKKVSRVERGVCWDYGDADQQSIE